MKKFYSLALCAAVALAASAEAPVLNQAKAACEKSAKTAMVKKTLPVAKAAKAPAKAPAKVAATAAEVAGEYEVSYTVELTGYADFAGEMEVTAGTAENSLVFHFPFVNGGTRLIWDINATLDPTTGDIIFRSDQESGFDGAEVKFRHWSNAQAVWEDVTEITAAYTGKAILFDEDDAFGLKATDQNAYYTLFDLIEMSKIIDDPNADPNEGWTTKGNATFVDPWVLPAFGFDQRANAYEVELQQNDEDADLYRLVDPYKGNSPVANQNESTARHGYIQFNVSDPDHVIFDVVEAGFANADAEITKMYCYNTLGWAMAYFEYEYTQIQLVSILTEYEMDLFTTFKDGVVTLGSRGTGSDIEYDACFGDQTAKDGGYIWSDDVDMTGSITFPKEGGVQDITLGAGTEAAVEYFNLQGVRVTEPAAGLYIRRQGNEVTKVVIR